MKPFPSGAAYGRIVVGVLALLIACAAPASAQNAKENKKPAEIRGQGCVEAGMAAHCLLTRDLRSGKLYNLIFKGLQPAVGTGIQFVGTLHKGPTACMQGTPLDVATWERSPSLKCKPAPAPENSAREK